MSETVERITKLEEETAHLRLQNEELSATMIDQWKQIEQLERKIARLEGRFAVLEDNLDPPEANVKPPHW